MEEKKPLSSAQFIIFDVSQSEPYKEPEKPVYTEQLGEGSNLYEVWTEGYAATGEHGTAFQLNLTGDSCTLWKGNSFQEATLNALRSLHWELDKYYDRAKNTYWACRFYDNETDARKSFG